MSGETERERDEGEIFRQSEKKREREPGAVMQAATGGGVKLKGGTVEGHKRYSCVAKYELGVCMFSPPVCPLGSDPLSTDAKCKLFVNHAQSNLQTDCVAV